MTLIHHSRACISIALIPSAERMKEGIAMFRRAMVNFVVVGVTLVSAGLEGIRAADPQPPQDLVRHGARIDDPVFAELKKAWPKYRTVYQDRVAVIWYDNWEKIDGKIVYRPARTEVKFEVSERAPFLANGTRYLEFPTFITVTPNDKSRIALDDNEPTRDVDKWFVEVGGDDIHNTARNAVDGDRQTFFRIDAQESDRWFQVKVPEKYFAKHALVGFVYQGRQEDDATGKDGLLKRFKCFAWTGNRDPLPTDEVAIDWPQSEGLKETKERQVVLFRIPELKSASDAKMWPRRFDQIRIQCLEDYSGQGVFSIAELQLILVANSGIPTK